MSEPGSISALNGTVLQSTPCIFQPMSTFPADFTHVYDDFFRF
jgi:hypothetical protein